MSLFTRPPESLDGYTPKFSREEMNFGYRVERVEVGNHFKNLDYDPDNKRYEDRHSITVLGHEIRSDRPFYMRPRSEIIVEIANDFLANKDNKAKYPEQWAFFTENSTELSNSRRYWDAVEHLEEVQAVRTKALEMLDQVRRAEWVASLYAAQVKAERWFTREEKDLLLAEFSGGEYGAKND